MASNGTATPSPSEDPPTPSSPPPSPPPPEPSNSEPSSGAIPSSAPPTSPSVSLPPPSSEPSSETPPPSSEPPSTPPTRTVTSTASSRPPRTEIVTSIVTPTPSDGGEATPSTLVVTVTSPSSEDAATTDNAFTEASATAPSGPAGLAGVDKSAESGGLSTGGKTAIAVVVPVVVVALLVLAGILFWRRRKQRKNAEEARRKEVEEYGFNPNHDPTLPAVGIASEMSEDQSGYRGWGNTTTSSNRKASTTLTSGMTYSDSNSNPGVPGSPTQADNNSHDPLMRGRRETLDSDGIGALGAVPVAGQNQPGVRRGPSNASSSYSGADHSDNSGDYPIPMNNPQDYYDQGYYPNNGYHAYGDGYGAAQQQPVIRDVSARRNTRIESPSVFPHQGNSGIAQNF